MADGVLKIATCQFAVAGSVKRNAGQICKFLQLAKKRKADIVHFPECALSGYAGIDIETFDGYDWELLDSEVEKIMALAAKLRLWVVLGGTHRKSKNNKPHNCLYLIGPDGQIADRYDKRLCMSRELDHYTPGSRFVKFSINGVKCALLICFEVRFPEIYRRLYKQGVQCILQSFYNARQQGPSVHSHIMAQSMQCRAASNYFWVSMSNSSGYYSPYPSCFIQPDGKIANRLTSNRAGLMVNTVDVSKKFYDPAADFRNMIIKGKFNF